MSQQEVQRNPLEPEILVGGYGYTSYDERDRLLAEDSVNYGWDQNGNLISKSGAEGATYEWDFESRLKRVVLANGTIVEHTYDVDGTRVRTVTTPSGGPVQVVEYLVDRNGALSQVVLEGGTVTAVSAYFVRGEDLISVIRPNEGSSPEEKFQPLEFEVYAVLWRNCDWFRSRGNIPGRPIDRSRYRRELSSFASTPSISWEDKA